MSKLAEREIFPQAPASLVKTRKRVLAKTLRWIIDDEGLTISRVTESLLGHYRSMHAIENEVRQRFPVFSNKIDMLASAETIEVHDDGEMIVGDLALSREIPDEDRVRWKHRERAAFRLMTRDYLGDEPQLKQQVRTAYQRYQVLDPEKLEDYKIGLFAHLVDKVQAARFGMVNVFKQGTEKPEENGIRSLENILKFTFPLLEVLPDKAARTELVTFVTEEIERFGAHGFTEITERGLQSLHDYLQIKQAIDDTRALDSVA
jgi:hypothetical protein